MITDLKASSKDYALPAWAGEYVGIPFAARGATREGCHCWGLVRLVMLERVGLALPSYAALSAQDVLAAARAFGRGKQVRPWQPVALRGQDETISAFQWRVRPYLAPFDVVLMTRRWWRRERNGVPAGVVDGHVGIMATPAHMLHVEQECDSVAVPLDAPSVRERITGVYRHEGLS